jgi:hypothetical protein
MVDDPVASWNTAEPSFRVRRGSKPPGSNRYNDGGDGDGDHVGSIDSDPGSLATLKA